MSQLFRFFGKNFHYLPGGITGLYIIINLIVDIYRGQPVVAVARLAKTIFAAEYTINQNVHLAIVNSPDYGFMQFFEILISVYIMYLFVKWVSRAMIRTFGANENLGAYVWALIILIVVEMSTIRIVDGVWGFVPIIDGVGFLFVNFNLVIINAWPFTKVVEPIVNETLVNVTTKVS